LKSILTPYIYILFYFYLSLNIYGQKNTFSLTFKSIDNLENSTIKEIVFKNEFASKQELHKTKDSIISILKERGYYSLSINNVLIKNNHHLVTLKLGSKINIVHIRIKAKDTFFLKQLNYKLKNNILILNSKDIKHTLISVNNHLINSGLTFSQVSLTNSHIINNTLYSDLLINRNKKRKIDKIIIKGYEKFPKSYIDNYFKLKNHSFNLEEIKKTSNKINQLNFVSEIKNPEVLFSKDSTLLYLYINKIESNSFDGLINFSSKNKKISFKGYLDLKLRNIFNKGEEIKINWKNNGNQKQDFTLTNKIPYVFGSKTSSTIVFNLYRHDSTYINSNFNLELEQALSSKINVSLLYNYENSKSSTKTNNTINYKKKFFGIGLNYHSLTNNGLNINLKTLYGTRSMKTKTNQIKINFIAASRFNLTSKTSFSVKNKTAVLIMDSSLLENELFREGGANSIRGFNEQSIFSPKFTYINSEFRYHSQNKSYLYSIHDLGVFTINQSNTILYSLGMGYSIKKEKNIIDISYALGSTTTNTILPSSSTLSIKFLTLF